jgi:hypothetical protein
MHFSRPFPSREYAASVFSKAPQLLPMYPITPDEVIEPVRDHSVVYTGIDRTGSRLGQGTAETAQVPSHHAGFVFHPHALSSHAHLKSFEDDEKESIPRGSFDSRPSGSSFSDYYASPPRLVGKARYYSSALSTDDHDTLIRGEHNHNLKVYTPKDMVMHYKSRKERVPRGSSSDKFRKMEALAKIEQEKQHSQRVMERNKVRRASHLPAFRLPNENGKDTRMTYRAYRAQAAQTMFDLCKPSSQVQRSEPGASALLPLLGLSRQFSFDVTPPAMSQSSHLRAASNGDYFSHRPARQLPQVSPLSPEPSSQRVRNPLAPQSITHRHNRSATFDAFLVPHKSGKGETFRGASNAKKQKENAIKDKRATLTTQQPQSAFRRLSLMPSMHSLKICKSRNSLRKDSLHVPPLPLLPAASHTRH